MSETTVDKICKASSVHYTLRSAFYLPLLKYCRKSPRYSDDQGRTSLYCGNACAKKAGAPLPNPEGLVKRSKDMGLGDLLIQEGEIERARSNAAQPASVDALLRGGNWKVSGGMFLNMETGTHIYSSTAPKRSRKDKCPPHPPISE